MNFLDFYKQYWKSKGPLRAAQDLLVINRNAKSEKVLKTLPVSSPVLDAGCGNGDFTFLLARRGYKGIGIDISSAAIKIARATAPQIPFLVASLEKGLPFGGDEFAAVWCFEVLEHLFDVHGALSELNRLLAKDGLLILTVPYHGLIKNIAIALDGFERHYNPYISHIRFYTRKSLGVCLSRAGFTVLLREGIGRFWPLWMSDFVVAQKTSSPGVAPQIIG